MTAVRPDARSICSGVNCSNGARGSENTWPVLSSNSAISMPCQPSTVAPTKASNRLACSRSHSGCWVLTDARQLEGSLSVVPLLGCRLDGVVLQLIFGEVRDPALRRGRQRHRPDRPHPDFRLAVPQPLRADL